MRIGEATNSFDSPFQYSELETRLLYVHLHCVVIFGLMNEKTVKMIGLMLQGK